MNSRRSFLRSTLVSLAVLSTGSLSACRSNNETAPSSSNSLLDNIGPLLAPDENGIMLPEGFTSRIIARSGQAPQPGSSYVWHDDSEVTGSAFSPDGKRLYFSSQRGTGGTSSDGITFEVSGPFHI